MRQGLPIRDLAITRIAALLNSGHLIEARTRLDLLLADPESDVHRYPLAVRALRFRIANGGRLPDQFTAHASAEADRVTTERIVDSLTNETAGVGEVDLPGS